MMGNGDTLNRLGMFLFAWGRTPPTSRDLVDAARTVESLGLDSVHVPCFFGLDTELWPWGNESVVDALPILPTIAAETERVRLCLSHWSFSMFHPYVWAQYLSSLQLASGGRTMTTLAAGRRWQEFQVGLSAKDESKARLIGGFEILDRLLAGDTVPDSMNGLWDVGGLRVDPAPKQPIEIWINGADDLTIDLTAQWAHFLKPSGKSPEEVRTKLRPALDAAEEKYGRQVGLAMSTLVFVTSPDDETSWLKSHVEPLIEHERPGGSPGGSYVYGSPEACAEQVTALFESGVDYITLDTHFHGWESLAFGMEQLQRFTETVVPLIDTSGLRPLPRLATGSVG